MFHKHLLISIQQQSVIFFPFAPTEHIVRVEGSERSYPSTRPFRPPSGRTAILFNYCKRFGLTLTIVLFPLCILSMEQPLKSALKQKATEKKHASFTADTKEEKNPFPNVVTVGVPGQGKFSPDSKYLVVPVEKKLVLYETQTCANLGELQNSSTQNSSDNSGYFEPFLIFSPASTYLTDKYHKHVWTVGDRKMIFQGPQEVGMNKHCIGWTFDEKKRLFVTEVETDGYSTFYCQQIDLKTDQIEKEFKFDCPRPKHSETTVSPNGRLLSFRATITYLKEYYQKIFNIEQGQEKCTIPNVIVTQFTPDSKYALMGTLGAKLMIIDTDNGSTLKEVNCNLFPSGLNEKTPFVNIIEIDAFKALIKTTNHWKKAAFKIPEGTRLENFEETDTTTPSTSGRFLLHMPKDNSTTNQAVLEDILNQTKKNLAVNIKSTSDAIFSPTDEIVVISLFPEQHVFDTTTGALLYTFKDRHFKFSPDGKRLLIYKKDTLEVLVSFNS